MWWEYMGNYLVVLIEEFQDTGLLSEHLLEKLKPISEVFVEELN